MSRGVKDLRDLICVSRLTYRDSDEEDFISSDDGASKELDNLSLSGSESPNQRGSAKGQRVVSPDSGCVVNASPVEAAASERHSGSESRHSTTPTQSDTSIKSAKKKKTRRRGKPEVSIGHVLPKPLPLPPVKSDFLASSGTPPPMLVPGAPKKRGNFDDMLSYMDATVVAGWLGRANEAVGELSKFCNAVDNYVNFAHFWLTEFPDSQKKDIYSLENEILLDEFGFAFAVGKESRKVLHRDIQSLLSAVFREYPAKLLGAKGNYLFLDYLDTLSSGRKPEYKQLLSDVRCSTTNKQYAQWLLATRSFALINIWTAVINFYRNLCGKHALLPGLPAPSANLAQNVHHQRLYQAIRLGYTDVVHYLIVREHVDPTVSDSHQRTLLFTAVMHNQPAIVHYLITRVKTIDVNKPSDTGNTPLHAAANSGSPHLVTELLLCPDIDVNCVNSQCENATPLHLAVMDGNLEVVRLLLSAKADVTMKMGDLTPLDIARDFEKLDILELLQEPTPRSRCQDTRS